METQPESTKTIPKLSGDQFVAEVTQKLEQLKLDDAETVHKSESLKRTSFSKFFNFKRSSSYEIASSPSDLKPSFSRLNRLFSKKEKKAKKEEIGQETLKQHSSFMRFPIPKWINRRSSQLKPINEEIPKN